MPRPIQATIDLPALRHNLAACRDCRGRPHAVGRHQGQRLWPRASRMRCARSRPPTASRCSILRKRSALRAAGWTRPILLLEGIFGASDLALVEALGLTVVVHNDEQLAWLATARPARPIDVYLKLNTGMNRLGFIGDEANAARRAAAARCRIVRIVSVMTHFANADRDDPRGAPASRGRAIAAFRGADARLRLASRCLANSAALFLQPRATRRLRCVRASRSMAARRCPVRAAARFGLRAGMHLTRRADRRARRRRRRRASAMARGLTAHEPMRVGIVACGYADGYPRVAPTARRSRSTASASRSLDGSRWT